MTVISLLSTRKYKVVFCHVGIDTEKGLLQRHGRGKSYCHLTELCSHFSDGAAERRREAPSADPVTTRFSSSTMAAGSSRGYGSQARGKRVGEGKPSLGSQNCHNRAGSLDDGLLGVVWACEAGSTVDRQARLVIRARRCRRQTG